VEEDEEGGWARIDGRNPKLKPRDIRGTAFVYGRMPHMRLVAGQPAPGLGLTSMSHELGHILGNKPGEPSLNKGHYRQEAGATRRLRICHLMNAEETLWPPSRDASGDMGGGVSGMKRLWIGPDGDGYPWTDHMWRSPYLWQRGRETTVP
jgi:hypothetical protein